MRYRVELSLFRPRFHLGTLGNLLDTSGASIRQNTLGVKIRMVFEGPCAYTCDHLREVHTGLYMTEAQSNAVVKHSIDAMRAQGIPRTP